MSFVFGAYQSHIFLHCGFQNSFTRLRDITLISVSKYFYVFAWYVHVYMFYVWYVHVLPAHLCVEARGDGVCLL